MTIDIATSFSQLMDVQNIHKITRFSTNMSSRKFQHSVQDGRIVTDSEGFVYIFNLFVCLNQTRFALAVISFFMYLCLLLSRK